MVKMLTNKRLNNLELGQDSNTLNHDFFNSLYYYDDLGGFQCYSKRHMCTLCDPTFIVMDMSNGV